MFNGLTCLFGGFLGRICRFFGRSLFFIRCYQRKRDQRQNRQSHTYLLHIRVLTLKIEEGFEVGCVRDFKELQKFKVRAKTVIKVPAKAYSEGVYLVRIIKPAGMGHLMPERGISMEHGKFSFNSTELVPKGTQLEVEITPVG